MSNSLVEIAYSQWPQLRDKYVNAKNKSSAYQLLQNYIDWRATQPDLCVRIFTLDEQWQEDGTFLLIDEIPVLNQVYFNTLADKVPDRLIKSLKCLDSKKQFLLSAYQDRFIPVVGTYLLGLGLTKEETRTDGTFWYNLPKSEAENFITEAPRGYSLAPLQLCNAEQVNKIWPHRGPGSVTFVKCLITYNESVGVFDEKKNELVAWCLRLPMGALGLLQVEEQYKRMGFGSLVVRYLSKLLAAKNCEIMAPVVFKNLASRSMFEKLGFKVIDKVHWTFKPAVV